MFIGIAEQSKRNGEAGNVTEVGRSTYFFNPSILEFLW